MGDMGDYWRDVGPVHQKRRAHNRNDGRAALDAAGIRYQVRNDGAHLIVESRVDFWPGTGRWRFRTGEKGWGVQPLLHALMGNR